MQAEAQVAGFCQPPAQPSTSASRKIVLSTSNDAVHSDPPARARHRRNRTSANSLRSEFLGVSKGDRQFVHQLQIALGAPAARRHAAGYGPIVASGSPAPAAERPAAGAADAPAVPTVSLNSSSAGSGGFEGGAEEASELLVGCECMSDVWVRCAQAFKEIVALNDPHHDTPTSLTFKQLERQMTYFATGLQQLGVTPGDRVALFADNSHRWFIADQGIMLAGGVDAVRGKDAPAEELAYIFKHSDSKGIVADNSDVVKKMLKHLDADEHPSFVVLLSGPEVAKIEGLSDDCTVLMYSEVIGRGQRGELSRVKTRGSDLATLIYTSGTTGKPKGVKLTHANLVSQLQCLGSILQPKAGDCVVSVLPSWHIYERTGEYFFLSRGVTNVYTSVARLMSDLEHYKPAMFLAVPRILEKFQAGVEAKLKKNPRHRLIQFLFAASLLYVHARRDFQGATATARAPGPFKRLRALLTLLLLWPLHRLGNLIVYKKIRERLGGRVEFAMSGGGSLAGFLDDWFEVVGVPVINGYGLTETSPVLSARRYTTNVRGTAGPPFPRTTIRVVHHETLEGLPQGETGLVMAKGPQVMVGYHKDVDATKKVLTRDGWFNTGDRGWFTHHGHLVLTGRYKDVIVLSNGENVEPMPIEDALLESPLIDQILCCGQDEKQLGALIVPNLDALKKLAKPAGEAAPPAPSKRAPRADVLQAVELVKKDLAPGERLDAHEVERAIEKEVQRLNAARPGFRPDERVGPFRLVLEPFTMENGLLTQSFKIKRNEVFDKYAGLIADMYKH